MTLREQLLTHINDEHQPWGDTDPDADGWSDQHLDHVHGVLHRGQAFTEGNEHEVHAWVVESPRATIHDLRPLMGDPP